MDFLTGGCDDSSSEGSAGRFLLEPEFLVDLRDLRGDMAANLRKKVLLITSNGCSCERERFDCVCSKDCNDEHGTYGVSRNKVTPRVSTLLICIVLRVKSRKHNTRSCQ